MAIMSRVDTFIFIFFSFFLLVIIIFNIVPHFHASEKNLYNGHEDGNISNVKQPQWVYFSNRKLLLYGVCTNRDISISQSRYSTTGIPGFIVQIVNTCISGCSPSNIHLHCGWFASTRLVNPRTFKRLSYDDCLVNGGMPLRIGQVLRFTYANSFMYPLSFKSAKFC